MSPAARKTAIVWDGNPQLHDHLVAIGEVTPHPDNPRRGHLPTIAESLKAHGQQKPIVVQSSSDFILAGNHTKLAAEEVLGWTHIAVVYVNVDDDQAAAYMLADNRSSDLGEYDLDKLLKSLRRFEETGSLVGTGYSAADVDDLVAEMRQAALTVPPDATPPPGRGQDTGGSSVMEFVVQAPEERHKTFVTHLGMLSREWGEPSLSAVILRAVEEAAKAL